MKSKEESLLGQDHDQTRQEGHHWTAQGASQYFKDCDAVKNSAFETDETSR